MADARSARPNSVEIALPVPQPLPVAIRFAFAHAAAILDQSIRGIHRTLPAWMTATLVIRLIRDRAYRQTGPPNRVGIRGGWSSILIGGPALQGSWSTSYAVVSGTRTMIRLMHPGSMHVIPVEITAGTTGSVVRACARIGPLGPYFHLEGVFAWPRGMGGGTAVMNRVIEFADSLNRPLVLTALSPRVAQTYERLGFRKIAGIYWMRREPNAGNPVSS